MERKEEKYKKKRKKETKHKAKIVSYPDIQLDNRDIKIISLFLFSTQEKIKFYGD